MATAIRRTRPRARRRIRARLRRLHWGWKVTALLVAAAAIRTWTTQILTALVVTTAIGITVAALYGRHSLRTRIRRTNGQLARWIPRPRVAQHADLADYLALDPTAFEHAIADLALRDPAVRSAIPQGGSNDRGLDVLVGLRDGRRILIQCKRYGPRRNVNSEDVQKTNGTYRDIHHCALAVIVTTSGYTRDAIQTNTMLANQLLLVDGPALAAWTAGGPPPWAGIAA